MSEGVNELMNERNIVMKKILLFVIMVVIALPMSAQNTQEWQSTSIMRGTGSDLSPQVTAVGAVSVTDMATTTTETYSPAVTPNGPRKIGPTHGTDNPNPLGDAVWPLLILACVYMVYSAARVYRRKRRV